MNKKTSIDVKVKLGDGKVVKVTYASNKEELLLNPLVEEFIESLKSLNSNDINFIWFDFGTSQYDLHIEFAFSNDYMSTDTYLTLANDELSDLTYSESYRAVDFIKDDLEVKLIEIIKKNKTSN